MDTARRSVAEGTAQIYDGFISYSHAADDLLAPRLQSALQRFAKPWWKRRALRIFRDESSLSANPHLWSSITEALDQSGWFVLLLSPDAAQSEWVNQEIEYWKEHRDPTRILPVLTDGEFSWSGSDVVGTSVPHGLAGVFSEEPRWVDIRFAKDEEHLDLKDPRFADAVADIASALRGVPKDELASEEVKQHRRTIRTAWAGTGLIGLLAIAALFFAFQSADNAQRAEAEALRANQEAAIARSRELAASAASVLGNDPELAVMLALESVSNTPADADASPEAVKILREGLLSNRLIARFENVGDFAQISPDGSTVYFGDAQSGRLKALDASSGNTRWQSDPLGEGQLGRVDVKPDGSLVTIQRHEASAQFVDVLEASNGRVIASLEPGEGCSGIGFDGSSEIGGFSPGGEWFSVFTGRVNCGYEPGGGWVSVYDTETWDEAHRLNTENGMAVSAEFSQDGSRVVISTSNSDLDFRAELRSLPDSELIRNFTAAVTPIALSPDGQRVAYLDNDRGPILADAESGEIISTLAHATEVFFEVEPFVFSSDGSKLLVATSTQDLLFDGTNGQYLGALGATGSTTSSSFTKEGDRALTVTGGTGLMWSLAIGRAIGDEGFEGDWVNPEQGIDGPNLAVNVIDFADVSRLLVLLDPDSGLIVARRGGWGTQLADGRFVVEPLEVGDSGYEVAPLEVWDPLDSSRKILAGCSAPQAEIEDDFQYSCPTGEPFFGGVALGHPSPVVSDPNSSLFAAQSSDSPSLIVVWNGESTDRVSEFEVPDTETLVGMSGQWLVTRQGGNEPTDADRLHIYDLTGDLLHSIQADRGRSLDGSVEFVAEDSLLLSRSRSGEISVYSTNSWEMASTWKAHEGRIRGWSVSPSGDHLATSGEAGFVHVWDISPLDQGLPPQSPRATFPTNRRASDVAWISEDRIAVFLIDLGASARWFTALLDTGDLVAEARSRLIRGFTDEECATYRIDPCPTLSEIRNR